MPVSIRTTLAARPDLDLPQLAILADQLNNLQSDDQTSRSSASLAAAASAAPSISDTLTRIMQRLDAIEVQQRAPQRHATQQKRTLRQPELVLVSQ